MILFIEVLWVLNAKIKKKYEGDEIKSKIISSIKGIDVPARLKDKEVDAKKAVEKQTAAINKKIPFTKDPNPYKKTKKKKKKKKNPGEGSSSSEGYSSEEGEGNSGNSGEGASESNSGSGSGSAAQ